MISARQVREFAKSSIWEHCDRLVSQCAVVVDRPSGVAHPIISDYVYPLDYGYLEGTRAGDGSGIDIWIGKGSAGHTTALLCCLDPVKRDAEIKIAWNCEEADLEAIRGFYDPQPQAVLIIPRPPT